MKAHIFRELVNDLRDIATQWHGSQQLRERISRRLYQDVSIDEDPANDGWIPWAGGKCPVDDVALVEIWRRDGVQLVGYKARPAIRWSWRNCNTLTDIIAYRIVRK